MQSTSLPLSPASIDWHRDPIRVYDARWEVDDFDDVQVARLFEATLAYGRLLGVDTVAMTRDARLGGPRVMEIGVREALRLGFRVVACTDAISTPQGYFVALQTTARHPNTMGLVVTASHNPASYIGVKFTVPCVRAIGLDCGPLGGLTKVREIYHSGEQFASRPGGELDLLTHPTGEFVEYSLDAAGVRPGELAGMRIVLDALHGSAGAELWHALDAAGARVTPLRFVPDGRFPTGTPNPTSRDKMGEALALAARQGADVVLGVDGDGDRIVFGDRRGILSAGFAALPVLRTLVEKGDATAGDRVLYDPKTNPLALAEWHNLGVVPVLFRNGHSQIKERMAQIGAVGGAEESGHYYHRLRYRNLTYTGENSLVTLLLFLKALKEAPGLMDELWALQQQLFTTGEFNYRFADDDSRDRALAAVVEQFAADGATLTSATEEGTELEGTLAQRGVRQSLGGVELADDWYAGYFRVATNEKSVVRSYLSTGDAALGRELHRRLCDLMEHRFDGRAVD